MGLSGFPMVDVFQDAVEHKKVADVIARHLVGREDIRDKAVNDLELGEVRHILDLGCGFGFFSKVLAERVHPNAQITGIDLYPGYEKCFLQISRTSGRKCRFICGDGSVIRKLKDASFDLIVCSYAMYFFPELTGEISRILTDKGMFVTITHSRPHMEEFTLYLKNILSEMEIQVQEVIPHDALVDRFSDLNGKDIMEPFFQEITLKKCDNMLRFGIDDFNDFLQYFNFKYRFFVPESIDPQKKLYDLLVGKIRKDLERGMILNISKNDVIFTGFRPRKSNVL
ncbi:MAG: class I SAM-dependent methyltransferase [Bacteroidetes bacterium]|nr:class I SAM-dependent methyltransferase [Bacteroidota bacterium]